ncbi:MAG: polysaccharide biosynthesis protein [Clostridia bacterium]|nr:polysaccharide biosynthesis protein [Clostridia bacterium]
MSSIDHKKQIRIGAVLSYVQMAVGIFVGIIYTPVMIRMLGQSEYGLYNTAASTISMLSILSLGFGSGYLRYYAKYKAKGDMDAIYRLNGMFMTIFTVVGIIALILGLFLTFNLRLVFDKGLTNDEYEVARVLMLLLTINLSLSFPMSVFGTIIAANERFIFHKLMHMGKTVLTPILTVPLLLAGHKSIAVVAVTVFIAILVDMANMYYVFFVLKDKFYFKNFEKGLFSSLFVYTSFIMINTIVKQVNWNIDKVLLGRFKGAAVVAIYAVASSLHVYYENFSTSVSSVFRTRVHMIVNTTELDSKEQREKLTSLFIKVGRVQFMVLGLVATGLIFFGYQFITEIWAGKGYEDSYYVTLLLVLPATIALIQNVGVDIQRALNRHKFRSIAYLIMSGVNLLLTIYLCQLYGAIGAAFGTAVSVFAVDGVMLNIYYHKHCNVDIIRFWKSIARTSVGLIPPVILGIVFNNIINSKSIPLFLAEIAVYTAVYAVSIWFLSLENGEKQFIKNKVSKIFRKRQAEKV